MSRRLPPLNAIRAFEAAARHLSFTRAADELNVTPAAISHQVKGLEEWFGIKLFQRRNREILMTEPGQMLLPGVRDALDLLESSVQRIASSDGGNELRVTCMPSFAAKWLIPRLGHFRADHPEIDVLLSTGEGLVDLEVEPFDIGIRSGAGNYPGLAVHRLFDDSVFPVCSPELLTGANPLRRPDDLARHTLLHDDYPVGWAEWLVAAGVSGVDPKRGPTFDNSAMLLQAAVEGMGVAMARHALAFADLQAGRLVRPFPITLASDFAYFLVHLPRVADQPKIAVFRDWVIAEAAAYRAEQDAG
ncbi:MAG: transcriptional regulator GcvA [Minwuia sp.]|uniref:transcriptional regulator GcvA n=1 Tax=Minwuia sp. TaxID=2493630 RepID=UPI003A867632